MNDSQGTVAFVLRSFRSGGTERNKINLANKFAENGYDVEVAVLEYDGEYTNDLSPGVRVIDLKCPSLVLSVFYIAYYLMTHRPNVLLVDNPSLNGMALLAKGIAFSRTRCVIAENAYPRIRGSSSYHEKSWIYRPAYAFFYRLYHHADAVVGVSRGVAEGLLKLPRIKPERVHCVYSPAIELETLEAELGKRPAHPWFAEGASVPVILYVGKLTNSMKNITGLVDAFGLLLETHGARLLILGRGPDRAMIEARVKSLGISEYVDMPGPVSRPYTYMANAAMHVLPSFMEGLSTVTIEALACGCPVISTDCTGANEILEDGRYGEVVPIDDPEALKNAMAKVLDGHVMPSETLRARGRYFTADRAFEEYRRIVDGLM